MATGSSIRARNTQIRLKNSELAGGSENRGIGTENMGDIVCLSEKPKYDALLAWGRHCLAEVVSAEQKKSTVKASNKLCRPPVPAAFFVTLEDMSTTSTSNQLLPPELLARLERLELVSRKVFRGRLKGERRSRRKGQSVEFADFRNYVPGDDLRLIDWNLYARLDQLFLKLFQEEEDLHFHALIDCSESMNFGDPTKMFVAKQLAASLGYVGLCRADRVSVSALGPEGKRAPVLRGRASLWKMLNYLDSLESGQNVSLYDGVREFSLRTTGTGVVVLLTDMMDKQGYESALRMLLGRRMDIFVMHILSPEEIDPPMRGDRRLIDVEDGDNAEVTVNAYVVEKYKETVQRFIGSIKSFCAKRSIVYLPVRTDMPVEQIVTRLSLIHI